MQVASVAILDLFSGDGGDAVAGDDDAGEVHGVGCGYGDDAVLLAGAGGAEDSTASGRAYCAAEAGRRSDRRDSPRASRRRRMLRRSRHLGALDSSEESRKRTP